MRDNIRHITVTLEFIARLELVLPKSYEIICLLQKDSLSIVWTTFHSSLCHPVIHNRAVVLKLLPVRKTPGHLACLKAEPAPVVMGNLNMRSVGFFS